MEILLVLVAAFCAGVLNTIAGGGTFLTFPALVFIGLPPVVANATSAVAVFPGYLGGALGFRDELRRFDRVQMMKLLAVTFVGGLIVPPLADVLPAGPGAAHGDGRLGLELLSSAVAIIGVALAPSHGPKATTIAPPASICKVPPRDEAKPALSP